MQKFTENDLEEIQDWIETTIGCSIVTELETKEITCFEPIYKVLTGELDKSTIDSDTAKDFIHQLELEQEFCNWVAGYRDELLDKLIAFLKELTH